MYLVTGAAGFIGSHIAQTLVERGRRVRVFDNLSTGKPENLEGWQEGAEVIRGDLRNADDVAEAVKGVRYVLHQAAVPSVPKSVEDPLGTNESNITGTLNLLLAAREEGVQRVVFASSSSVYGDLPSLPKRETDPTIPLSPYALQKLTGEHYMRQFHSLYGLETVCLRYFNVFGPRQDPESLYAAVIPRFITAVAEGGRPTIYGDGLQTRDFTYVQNVVEANLGALEAPNAAGQVINVAAGVKTSLLDLLEVLSGIFDTEIDPVFEDERPGDIKHSVASNDRAGELLDFEIVVDLEQGLRRTVEWFTR